MKSLFTSLFSILIYSALFSQNLTVKPYLQNAEPTSITIMWETSSNTESRVDYGLTPSLGNVSTGISINNPGGAKVHEVEITGLQPSTKYYYSTTTDMAKSDTFFFLTPPLTSEEKNFKMIAISDMQQDNGQPDKFREIVEDGIITYVNQNFPGTLDEELAFVLIPGDLVDNGLLHSEWVNEYFKPAQKLYAKVPSYPVYGNHEINTNFFTKFFDLPENGSSGGIEHWWYKDYSNVRVIGLDSNLPTTFSDQLTWLQGVLDSTCSMQNIDFLFLQLHHPHHSELWPTGNLPFTGQVLRKLEEFSTNCGIPSIHHPHHSELWPTGNLSGKRQVSRWP